jgi:hypothetical protein
MLSYAGRADRHCIKNLKLSILSAEAKFLSAIIDNKECIIKVIHNLSGLSERHCYNAISNLIAAGVLKKEKSSQDSRTKIALASMKRVTRRLWQS